MVECDCMKNVVISADGDRKIYSVPDVVANNLSGYCIEFCNEWIRNSPQAKKYRIGDVVCYNEDDFIEYLNTYVFPDEKSVLVKNLGWIDFDSKLPAPYCDYPEFNFQEHFLLEIHYTLSVQISAQYWRYKINLLHKRIVD